MKLIKCLKRLLINDHFNLKNGTNYIMRKLECFEQKTRTYRPYNENSGTLSTFIIMFAEVGVIFFKADNPLTHFRFIELNVDTI